MKSVLTLAILLFVWSYLLAQPTFKYGNSNANYPSLIKNDANNVYILGQEDKNGTSYGTITKLDANSGNIIWQKELDFPSQINDMVFIPPQGPLGKTSLYIVGHTLPFDINNASFMVQINGETNAIECSNIFNQTGRESFRKIIRHSNPSNPNFPYYILGSKGIQGGSVTQDKVVLINLRSFCSGGTNVNFVKEFSFFANPLDREFSRGLTALSDGSILLMGNETNNGFGMAVKLTGAGNFVNGVTFSADMEVMDAVELPNFNIVFSGTRFSNSIQSGVLFVTDSKLAILGKAYENKNVLIYNDIVSETPGSYYLHSLYKPVQNSNNTSFPLIQKMFIGGSAALPSLAFLWQKSLENNAANGIYKGLSLTANFSGDLFYTDGRGLNNTNPDFTYAKSNSSFQLPCTDSLTTSLISFELGYNNIEITSSPATLPAPTQGNYRNTDWNRTAFCAEPCQLDFTISTTERECNNVLCNINIINGSLPYTLSWDFNCDGTVDATGIPAQYTFTSSGSHQVCIKVMDGKKCVKEKSFTIITNGDGEAPVLTCPDNITIQCNGSTDPSNTGIPTVTDNADSNPTLTALDDLVTENTPCLKKIVRSWKAEDDCKNESNCTQIITIKDENAPVFTSCGRKIEVQGIKDANGKCKEKVTLISPVVIDQCDSNPSIVNSYTNTNNATADYFEGETIVTWTATDQCGNKSVCRDTVIVNCDPCCINRQDFIDRVENAITFSINTEECQVSLSVNGLLSCDELTQINWGDGNLTNNITATTITHHYTGSGSYSINLFFTENNISGIRCFEYLIRKTVNIQCLCPEFGNLTITNNNTCVSDSIISSRTMTTINAPLPRSRSSLVWTGKEMIVWGGQSGFATYGSRYNLDLDIWNPISNINAPSHRVAHNALWTGKEMIIWGGLSTSGNIPLNDGAIYNPETDTWRSMDGTNAPLPTNAHSAIWTGKEMIIYGGILWATNTFVGTDTGSKYNITTDTWESITTGGGNRLD
nr:PKD domain-containing protein [Saprospiraceae bacterium]